jgi:hypothetical protein
MDIETPIHSTNGIDNRTLSQTLNASSWTTDAGITALSADNFSAVAQRLNVYTAIDYANIIRHLVDTWSLETLDGLDSTAEKERQLTCKLPDRYLKVPERSMKKKKKATEDEITTKSFSWIHGRKA